jgi:hypothetical protein
MAYNAKKTEHAAPKKGAGAYYGRKSFAKKASNRRRRENDKHEVLIHGTSQALTSEKPPGRLSSLQAIEDEWFCERKGRRGVFV